MNKAPFLVALWSCLGAAVAALDQIRLEMTPPFSDSTLFSGYPYTIFRVIAKDNLVVNDIELYIEGDMDVALYTTTRSSEGNELNNTFWGDAHVSENIISNATISSSFQSFPDLMLSKDSTTVFMIVQDISMRLRRGLDTGLGLGDVAFENNHLQVTAGITGFAYGPQSSQTFSSKSTSFYGTLKYTLVSAPTSDAPSGSPSRSSSPSAASSGSPSRSPSGSPSAAPSDSPSRSLSVSPSAASSGSPSNSLSDSPSAAPSGARSGSPSVSPSAGPSDSPSRSPSGSPSSAQSDSPSRLSSVSPSAAPSGSLSNSPSDSPSAAPSDAPSGSPSVSPGAAPSDSPSRSPSGSLSAAPSDSPSRSPSFSPSAAPSGSPSNSPSGSLSIAPSDSPSRSPSGSPSSALSDSLSNSPTMLVSVTAKSTLRFNSLKLTSDNEDDFISALQTSLTQALVPRPTSVKVIEINGVPVGGSRAFVRRLQAGGVNEVVVSSTQTVWTSGDATDAEEELRQSLVNSLDLVDVSAALDTEEMQKFGNFTLGAISTDLGDGIDPISESVSPTIRSNTTNNPTMKPTDCSPNPSDNTTNSGKGKSKKGKSGKTKSGSKVSTSSSIPCLAPTPKPGKDSKSKLGKKSKNSKSKSGKEAKA